ncbi:MAG: twin-arginine translocase subunit TatC [Propionibacteriaceae bacterium]
MSLVDHLRELRYRLIISLLVIVVGMIVAAFFYQPLLNLLMYPWQMGIELLKASHPDITATAVNTGLSAPFMLMMKLIGVAGLVGSCPIWLYQIWAFIAPGLLAKEKKWALLFLGSSIPLFLCGVAVGYWVMPQGIAVMLAFTPEQIEVMNLVDMPSFLDVLIAMMLLFGASFLLPVVVLALNFAGVVSAATLAKSRPYLLFGCVLVGAMATPGSDPFSMLALAFPMMLLFVVAEVIAHIHDRMKKTHKEKL